MVNQEITSISMAARIKKEAALRRHFIAEWRELRGWTTADLARAIGSSKQAVGAIETMSAPYSQHSLELIADALLIEPAWLLLAPPATLDNEIIRALRRTDFISRFQPTGGKRGRPRRN